jgi:hypothetical protein
MLASCRPLNVRFHSRKVASSQQTNSMEQGIVAQLVKKYCEFRCRVHKSPSMTRTFSQSNELYSVIFWVFKVQFSASYHHCLGISSGLVPSYFNTFAAIVDLSRFNNSCLRLLKISDDNNE